MLPALVLCAVTACLAIAAVLHERHAARREEAAEKVRERQEETPPANAGPAGNPPPPSESSAAAGPHQAENAPTGGGLAPPDQVADTKAKIEALKQESLAVANRLREDFPDSLDALGLVGKVQCYYGNTAQTTECWEQCVRRDPSRDDFYDALATVALRKAEHEKAAEWCRKGLAQNPEAPRLHGRLGEALTGLGRLEEALPELERETRISPTYAEGHYLLGQAYSLLHEYRKAKTCHEAAVKLQPNLSKYHFALASACAKLGLDEEARQHSEAIRQMRDSVPSYDDLLDARLAAAATCGDAAAVYRSQRNFSKAEELLKRAAALDAKKTDYRTRLALILLETGRHSEAAKECQELIEIEPRVAAHYFNLGIIYARMRQFEAARKAAQRALELAPDNPQCKKFHEQMERAPR